VTGVFVPAGVKENSLWREAGMPMKKYKPEQIVTLLRQVEVGLANGKTTPQACKAAEITAQTHYRWRKEFGGLKLEPVPRCLVQSARAVLHRLRRRIHL
jgi:putative transposase